MRLHRLTLRDFRGVAEQTLEFATGVTVVIGDNETGKSTMLEALDLLFTLPDDSKAARLRSVQPVGRDVGSEVAAEVTLGPLRLSYRKRWFRNRLTELSVRADPDQVGGGVAGDQGSTGRQPGPEVEPRSFTGRQAHDEARRLFAEQVDEMLWRSLVVAQQHSTTLPTPGSVGAVLTALSALASSEADSMPDLRLDPNADPAAALPLAEAVEREYLRYYTRAGKPTGGLAESIARLEAAEASQRAAEEAWTAVEHDIHRAERLAADQRRLDQRLTEHRDVVAAADERRRAASALIARLERLRGAYDLAVERLTAARAAQAARTTLAEEVAQRTQASAEGTAEATQRRVELRAAETELGVVTDEVRAARTAQAAARDRVARLEAHAARQRERAELAELSERCAAVEQARTAEQQALLALEANGVDEQTAANVEEAHRAVLVARAALDAGLTSVGVRRLGGTAVEIMQPGTTTTVRGMSLPAEEGTLPFEVEPADGDGTTEVVIDQETTVRAPGVVELTIRPGAGASGLAAEVECAEHTERELLAELGLADIAAVRQAARDRQRAEHDLAVARETLNRRLAGATVDELRSRRELLAARVDEDSPADGDSASESDLLPEGDPLPESADATAEAIQSAREAERVATAALEDAEDREAQARKAVDAASEAATTARVRAEQEAERCQEASRALAQARGEIADEQLVEALAVAEQAVEEAQSQLAQAQEEAAAQGAERAEQEYTDAIAVRDQLSAQVAELHDELGHLQGRLEMAGSHGLSSQLDAARTEYELAQAEHETVSRRAAAAARLRSTLQRHRAQARRRYAAPLRDRIVALGQALHQTEAFDVTLGDDLDVLARELDGVSVGVDALSTGAREQLATLVRLAVAGLTAADGSGVPVVLDDALAWSDPGRLYAMGGVLAKAGAHSQVILLTCAPDRYAYVPGAHVVRI